VNDSMNPCEVRCSAPRLSLSLEFGVEGDDIVGVVRAAAGEPGLPTGESPPPCELDRRDKDIFSQHKDREPPTNK
jgi:hypothetical protein